jgi:hypothetical protein
MGPGALLWDIQMGTRLESVTAAPLCASVPIDESEIRETFNPLSIISAGREGVSR